MVPLRGKFFFWIAMGLRPSRGEGCAGKPAAGRVSPVFPANGPGCRPARSSRPSGRVIPLPAAAHPLATPGLADGQGSASYLRRPNLSVRCPATPCATLARTRHPPHDSHLCGCHRAGGTCVCDPDMDSKQQENNAPLIFLPVAAREASTAIGRRSRVSHSTILRLRR
jgi:hypothetical protein